MMKLKHYYLLLLERERLRVCDIFYLFCMKAVSLSFVELLFFLSSYVSPLFINIYSPTMIWPCVWKQSLWSLKERKTMF